MGIARALERVKRARQEGLQGVITGLGRELRSEHVPSPLRAAAQRIAALLPVERSTRTSSDRTSSEGRSASAVSHAAHAAVATERAVEQAAEQSAFATDAEPSTGVHRSVATAIADDTGRARDGVSPTGSDDGAEPGPLEPEAGTPVDPEAVGATPEVLASVTQVEPVDASPVDVQSDTATDASPVEVAPVPANPALPQLEPDDAASEPASSGVRARTSAKVVAASADEKTEEGLAPDGEAAKNLAHSGSRSKKRSRSKGTTSKKK